MNCYRKLISNSHKIQMQKIIPILFLAVLLIPISQINAQEYSDNTPTLTVSLQNETPFVYQDSEGFTVVVGVVENNNELTPVTNVQVQVKFYDDLNPQPIETVTENVSLEVIPANGVSPYSIRSATANPYITQAAVSLVGFDSSNPKENALTIYSNDVSMDTELHFTGTLENGGAPISDTNVYLAIHDAFDPPRILSVETVEIGQVAPNDKITFEFNGKIDARAVGLFMVAESNIFNSDIVEVAIPPPEIATTLGAISDVSIQDNQGKKLSELQVGVPVNIKSTTTIQFAADQEKNETAYTYYVQIKESGEIPYVAFLGKYDGRFVDDGIQYPTIDWIPEKKGLFFVETFVWDRNDIPIAEQGPFVLIVVN